MAEILLSLTIIGVVAAITLPSLTGNINERTWNTQRKALYARMSQAISLMPNLNGYGSGEIVFDDDLFADVVNGDTDEFSSGFVTAGLSKVLKINNVCDNTHLQDCGIPAKLTTMNGGSVIDWPLTFSKLSNDELFGPLTLDTKAAALETQNGESIAVYYNPRCDYGKVTKDSGYDVKYWDRSMCVNFVYDLNGNKGPNTVGKDIGFMSVFYPTDSQIVAPLPVASYINNQNVTFSGASNVCRGNDSETRLPNYHELNSIALNQGLLGFIDGGMYWSSSKEVVNNNIYNVVVSMRELTNWYFPTDDSARALCVKR